MNQRRLVVVVLVCVLTCGVFLSAAYAESCGKKGDSHRGQSKDKFFHKAHKILANKEELRLTDEQSAKIKALKLSTKKDLIMKKAEIEVIALDIKAQLWQDTVDIAAVNKLIDEKYEIKKAKTKALVAAQVALKDTLTEKQRKELKELYGKSKKKMKAH